MARPETFVAGTVSRNRLCTDRHGGKKLVTPAARREAWQAAQEELGLSQRRACRLVGILARWPGMNLGRKNLQNC